MVVDYDWEYFKNLFNDALTFTETSTIVESDREVKFKSKPMVLFQNYRWSLEMGRLPDLRFQNVNIDTKIHKSVTDFMNSTGFLGLLIGTTGCGKSHEMIRRAKMEFTNSLMRNGISLQSQMIYLLLSSNNLLNPSQKLVA